MPRIGTAKDRLMEAAKALIWESSYGATSVDDICARAGVKKGSFYHFFDGKAALAIAAIDAGWKERRAQLDQIFSPMVPPLERFRQLIKDLLAMQEKMLAEKGCVCGCPLFTLGSEIGTQEQSIRAKVEEILSHYLTYYESALRDAHAAGLAHAPNPAAKSRILFAYIQGTMTEARISNSLDPLLELEAGILDILGVLPSMAQ